MYKIIYVYKFTYMYEFIYTYIYTQTYTHIYNIYFIYIDSFFLFNFYDFSVVTTKIRLLYYSVVKL